MSRTFLVLLVWVALVALGIRAHIPLPQAWARMKDAAREYDADGLFLEGLSPVQRASPWPTVSVFDATDRQYPPFDVLACFRIPSLVRIGHVATTDNASASASASASVLVAFAEARTPTCADCSTTAIVAKRSTDGGRSWSPMQYVVPPDDIGANPTTVYDRRRERIVLYYVRGESRDPDTNATTCSPGASNWFVTSRDGLTWTAPTPMHLGAYAGGLPGPGNAAQLANGRLVVPIHYGTAEREWGRDLTAWSDDGVTYETSNTVARMDEATVAGDDTGDDTGDTNGTPDNGTTLGLWMRNAHHNASCGCKARSLSVDGGQTWSAPVYDPQLLDPICQGSATVANGTLYFVGPNFRYARARLTLWHKPVGRLASVGDWTATEVTDASTYSDYSAVVGFERGVGVLWGTCAVPLPFRVWCAADWGVAFSVVG